LPRVHYRSGADGASRRTIGMAPNRALAGAHVGRPLRAEGGHRVVPRSCDPGCPIGVACEGCVDVTSVTVSPPTRARVEVRPVVAPITRLRKRAESPPGAGTRHSGFRGPLLRRRRTLAARQSHCRRKLVRGVPASRANEGGHPQSRACRSAPENKDRRRPQSATGCLGPHLVGWSSLPCWGVTDGRLSKLITATIKEHR
jgi:hypothetical protein